jgi:hypothetical protein
MLNQNRFQIFTERGIRGEQKKDNLEFTRQDFIDSSVDNKLLHMFDELKFIRNEQVSCSRSLVDFKKYLVQVD